MLAGSVDKKDLGKAFGFHEAMDTLGALIGPAIAFLLLSTGHGFNTIFAVAIIPGVLAFTLFALVTRDPRPKDAYTQAPPDFKLSRQFWRRTAIAYSRAPRTCPTCSTERPSRSLEL